MEQLACFCQWSANSYFKQLVFYNLDAKEYTFAYRARLPLRETDRAHSFNKYSFHQRMFE